MNELLYETSKSNEHLLHGIDINNIGQLPTNTNYCATFIQHRPNDFNVGPILFKFCTNVLCLLGSHPSEHDVGPPSAMLAQR